jgi:hypothetical protein
MRRITTLSVWLAFSSGCYSWQPVSVAVPQPGSSPMTMRVTLVDGSQVVIHDASLNAIGVRGWAGVMGSRTLYVGNRAQLDRVEIRQPDLESTVLLTVAAAVATMVFLGSCANNAVFCLFP